MGISLYVFWILLSTWLVFTGWVLSFLKELNVGGYIGSLFLFGLLNRILFHQGVFPGFLKPIHRWRKLARRFQRPPPLIFLLYLLAAFIGGVLYPPSNYDALCYRLPRILHWWSEGGWHWIGGYNIRMDYSATGFEWLAAPLLILLRSDRPIFFINLISYALMPGLIFALLRGLGIGRRVAWAWMWILPTAYCFVLQAGGIGNDMFAAVYFLAAAVFALRATKSHCWTDAALSMLSAALMTGSKATNLPLLLPLGVIMLGMLRVLAKSPFRSLALLVIACGISFLPMALMNLRHTGDWTGDPSNSEKMKLSDPLAGLAGNSLETVVGALLPPLFPMAKSWNACSERLMEREPLKSIRAHYPRLALAGGELATEEGAGVGPGILILCLVSLGFCMTHRCGWRFERPAMLFGMLCWVAFLVYMAKMGSESAARLAAPYYPGLVILFIAVSSRASLTHRGWWKILAVVCALSVLPAVLLNPARPMIPSSLVLHLTGRAGVSEKVIDRIRMVYAVYDNRSDNLAALRDRLPEGCRSIGFAGSGNESEYSLWKPFGARRVVDAGFGSEVHLKKADCLIGSREGIFARFSCSPEELASRIGGDVTMEVPITLFAGKGSQNWVLILPASAEGFHVPAMNPFSPPDTFRVPKPGTKN